MGSRGPRRRGFYSALDRRGLMSFATSGLPPTEARAALLGECNGALEKVLAARHLALDLRLQLQLLAHSRVQPVVQLALGPGIRARRPGRQARRQLRDLLAELRIGHHAIDQAP